MLMNAIVSVTRDWGIGRDGRLAVRNRADMRYFRETTMGGTVVCGRTTFESFPGGALKGRRNVVLSRNPAFAPEGVEVVASTEEALRAVAGESPHQVWLIGGEQVYRELLGECDRAFVTYNDVAATADAFFLNLDEDEGWVLEDVCGGGTTDAGVAYEFRVYRNRRRLREAEGSDA